MTFDHSLDKLQFKQQVYNEETDSLLALTNVKNGACQHNEEKNPQEISKKIAISQYIKKDSKNQGYYDRIN